MKLQKVKLITINQYPTTKPYIKTGEYFINFVDDHLYEATQDYQNKKVLSYWQPITFSLVFPDDEDQIILTHDQLLNYKFRVEMLDEVMTEGGIISTKFKDFNFDLSLCELILSQHGICWLDENTKTIHLQENQMNASKSYLKKNLLIS